MRASIIRIGNSRGLRIPKALLEQCGIGDAVDLSVEHGRLVINPMRRAREGWAVLPRTDDGLLDPPTSTRFDDSEWEW